MLESKPRSMSKTKNMRQVTFAAAPGKSPRAAGKVTNASWNPPISSPKSPIPVPVLCARLPTTMKTAKPAEEQIKGVRTAKNTREASRKEGRKEGRKDVF